MRRTRLARQVAHLLILVMFAPLAPASAATVANFEGNVAVSVAATPGEELFVTSTANVPLLGSGASGAATAGGAAPDLGCCTSSPVPAGPATALGQIAIEGDAQATGIGAAEFTAEASALFEFANLGNMVETVTLTLDYVLGAAAGIDPLVGGFAGAGARVVLQQGGATILDEPILVELREDALGPLVVETVSFAFDVAPTDSASETISLSLTGGARVEVAPVPLPGGLALLLSAFGPAFARRRRGHTAPGGARP